MVHMVPANVASGFHLCQLLNFIFLANSTAFCQLLQFGPGSITVIQGLC